MKLIDTKLTPEEARFMTKVTIWPAPDNCWIWTGGKDNKNHFGIFYLDDGKRVAAHRYIFKIATGDYPEDNLRNECGVPWCVNLEHYYLEDVSTLLNKIQYKFDRAATYHNPNEAMHIPYKAIKDPRFN